MIPDDDLQERLRLAEEGRRAAVAALNESQRLARIGSWSWQVDPDIVTWSDEMFRIAGREPAAGAPSYSEQATMYASPEVLAAAIAETLRTGDPFEQELELVRPDGQRRFIVSRGAAVTDATGRVVRVYGTARDVTEAQSHRRALDAAHDKLERSERRYRDLVENLIDVVFSMDLEGRVEYVSPAIERFGYTVQEMVGEHFSRMLHPEDQAAGESAFRNTLGGTDDPAEFRVLSKGGDVHHVQVSARAVFDDDGQITGLTGVVVDVTQQRHAEEQLRVAQRLEAVGRLAGGIAHDFNNLLVVILGFADLTLDRLGPDDPVRAHVEQICRAGERAAELIRQLLAFSRRQVLKPEVVDLNEIVRGVEGMLLRLIGEDVVFRTRLRARIEPVLADPGQIEQVLMNLVVNARDAMPGGGTVTIETARGTVTERTAGLVLLRVRDTGHGMDEATKTRMFEPFFTTKPQGEGTGLGLSTVYGIVKQSGGTVSVETVPGKGTTLTLAFPAELSGARAVKRMPEREGLASARDAATVLIVEPEEAVRDLASRFLSTAGYKVIAVGSGAEAQRAFDAHGRRVDLLLTEMVMPVMTGETLAAGLQAGCPELRVLFMADYSGARLSEPVELKGETRVVAKPFTRNELSRRVRDVLDEEPR